MKSDRRHELKENELAHAVEVGREFLRKHGSTTGLAVVVVVAAVLVATFMIRAREADMEDVWQRKSQLSFEPDVARESLDALRAMAAESNNDKLVLSALLIQGEQALRLAADAGLKSDQELNDIAREAYQTLLRRFAKNPLISGRARLGLATVAENDFAVDGDLAHKAEAIEQLAAVMDDTALHTTPYYRIARDRREALDKTFTQVVFAPPLPPEEAASVGPPGPPTGLPEGLQVKQLGGPPPSIGDYKLITTSGRRAPEKPQQPTTPEAPPQPPQDEPSGGDDGGTDTGQAP